MTLKLTCSAAETTVSSWSPRRRRLGDHSSRPLAPTGGVVTVGDGATAAHLHGDGRVMSQYFEGILRRRGPVDWPISISQLFPDLVRITESGMWFSVGSFPRHVGVSWG